MKQEQTKPQLLYHEETLLKQDRIDHIQIISEQLQKAAAYIAESIIGNSDIIKKLLIAILSQGHVLLEGVPGIAKTKIVVELAKICGLSCNRVQCTPDLLPSDITGMALYQPHIGKFETYKGPIFTHILIADELNRTPPKVQSALLQAMAEKQVTIFGTTHTLDEPFFVMATQNPIEQEGTYPLPEAQLDRFMCKLVMKPFGIEEEKKILIKAYQSTNLQKKEAPVLTQENIQYAISSTKDIYVDETIIEYIAKIVVATRQDCDMKTGSATDSRPTSSPFHGGFSSIRLGASPRASLALLAGARACALYEGREFVLPADVKYLAPDILRHRIVLGFEEEAKGITIDSFIEHILLHVPCP